jgi:hypothetical protein
MSKLVNHKPSDYVVSYQIFRNRFHQLHCYDRGVGCRKPLTTFCCGLGSMDHLSRQLAVEKEERAGQRATDPGNPGQTLESKQELQRSKRSE